MNLLLRPVGVACALLLLLTALESVSFAGDQTFIRGDINADGVVDSTDIQLWTCIRSGSDTCGYYCFAAGDVNDDGVVDFGIHSADYVQLQCFVNSGGTNCLISAPYPTCGVDPTANADTTTSYCCGDSIDNDGDGVVDSLDNCIYTSNPGQEDTDGDGVGDSCDICVGYDDSVDSDGDGIPDGCDVCPGAPDENDWDSDGIPDECDVCAYLFNPDQADSDGDGVGDACAVFFTRGDVNADGIVDSADLDPLTRIALSNGSDTVGVVCPLAADVDDDGLIGINDWVVFTGGTLPWLYSGGAEGFPAPPPFPNCGPDPTIVDTTTLACCAVDSLDDDGDGITNGDDNCVSVFNPFQEDSDADGVGDSCDVCPGYDDTSDSDGDSVPDSCDVCPDVYDPDQTDSNSDGVGDACTTHFFTRGDVNADGVVDSVDLCDLSCLVASSCYQAPAYSCPGVESLCESAADVNDDGVIDGADTTYLNAFVHLDGPLPPPPYPYCGIDPTSPQPGSDCCAPDTVISPPEIFSVNPSVVGSGGGVTVNIVGDNFLPNTRIQLIRDGYTDIETNPQLINVEDVNNIRVVLDTRNVADGLWSIRLTAPDGRVTILNDALTVEPGYTSPWISLSVPESVRPDRWGYIHASYGNNGNQDLFFSVLVIEGIPLDGELEPTFEIVEPDTLFQDGGDTIAWSDYPNTYVDSTDGVRGIALLIPKMAAGDSYSLSLRTTVPVGSEDYQIDAYILDVGIDSIFFDDSETALRALGLQKCILKLAELMLDEVFGQVAADGKACLKAQFGGFLAVPKIWVPMLNGDLEGAASAYEKMVTDGLVNSAQCLVGFLPQTKVAETLLSLLKALKLALKGKSIYDACNDPILAFLSGQVGVVSSWDPNDKLVPTGAGEQHFIRPDQLMTYTIQFENVDSATLYSDTIWVTDTLSPLLDWSTLELGEIYPGDGPDSIRPAFNPIVTTDEPSRSITWQLSDINLPPDTFPHWGEGWVQFSIELAPGLTTGTMIENIAEIKFDVNDWILAPMDSIPKFNTIDADAPTSTMLPLPDTTNYPTFMLTWSGDDGAGSGVESVDIYYSENEGPFVLWALRNSLDSVEFIGAPGNTYQFYCHARDFVGYVEEFSPVAHAETFVNPSCCAVAGDASSDENVTIGDVTFLINRIFSGGPAPACCEEGDADGSGAISIGDVTYLIGYIFGGGASPSCGPSGMSCFER